MINIRINKELIRRARQANLLEYLEMNGYTFKREGQRFRCKEHNSLIITPPNAFYWNSKGISGNSIDFLMKCQGYTFKSAIEALTDESIEQKNCLPQSSAEKDSYKINNSYINRCFAYLCKTRKLSNSTISYLTDKSYINMLSEGPYKYPVIGFKVLDEDRVASGYEVQGSFDKARFKGVTTDTKYGYGFNLIYGKPLKAIFFESPIDLLSFKELSASKIIDYDTKNTILISLAGLKVNILTTMLEAFNIELKPVLAIDNDVAAEQFKLSLIEKDIKFDIVSPPKQFKDWNEFLIDNK